MCLAIPMQVVSSEDGCALCAGRSGTERLNTLLTGPLEPGQWVLGFLGSARAVISEEHAAQVDSALDALESLLNGHGETGDVEALMQTHFADLVNREPQLPDFLKP